MYSTGSSSLVDQLTSVFLFLIKRAIIPKLLHKHRLSHTPDPLHAGQNVELELRFVWFRNSTMLCKGQQQENAVIDDKIILRQTEVGCVVCL